MYISANLIQSLCNDYQAGKNICTLTFQLDRGEDSCRPGSCLVIALPPSHSLGTYKDRTGYNTHWADQLLVTRRGIVAYSGVIIHCTQFPNAIRIVVKKNVVFI